MSHTHLCDEDSCVCHILKGDDRQMTPRKLCVTYTVSFPGDEDSPEVSIGYRVYQQEDEEGKFYSVSQFNPSTPNAPEKEVIEEWSKPNMPTLAQIEECLNDEYCAELTTRIS